MVKYRGIAKANVPIIIAELKLVMK